MAQKEKLEPVEKEQQQLRKSNTGIVFIIVVIKT